jgi:transposase-like protein
LEIQAGYIWQGSSTMITCFHQRNGLTYFDVPSTMKKSLIDLICKNIKYGSTIYTDEYRAYDSLEEHGFVHKNRSLA